jgi:signal transduction histidine kinase
MAPVASVAMNANGPRSGHYLWALLPMAVLVAVLVGWLVQVLLARGAWWHEADQANLREWLDETRIFRKTLPELAADYLRLHETTTPATVRVCKRAEVQEQLRSLADPTRIYQGQLPLFPEIYRLEVRWHGLPDEPVSEWVSPVPVPRRPNQPHPLELRYPIAQAGATTAELLCVYRLHAFHKTQRDAAEQHEQTLIAAGLVLTALVVAGGWCVWFLRRDQAREAARQAAECETLELRSQIYVNIGIMAGAYAHNIKNLLVRPHDLLARCRADIGVPAATQELLGEVQQTLGAVGERLQQILRTVQRTSAASSPTALEVNAVVRELEPNWGSLAREQWKLTLTVVPSATPAPVTLDGSHLQQALENLLFNARDATYEQRRHLRAQAHALTDPTERKSALLTAASWRGAITITVTVLAERVELSVRDTGIGMSAEVQARCTEAHFSTKRGDALYEGAMAGSGLGLSFVQTVLRTSGGTLRIESAPTQGTTVTLSWPRAN